MALSFAIIEMKKNPWIPLLLVFLTAAGLSCVSSKERMQPLKEMPPPHIDTLSPSSTLAGKGFQVQPSGDSAVSVTGSNFVSASRICFNGKPAATAFGSSAVLTAIVPSELYGQAGAVEVTVENGDGKRSNVASFHVLPASGLAPLISRLVPDSCITGQGFNLQPNGESALAVVGANFVPGAVIYFDTSPLATAFADPGTVTAIVPAHLLKAPRAVNVHVRNPDGKASAPSRFTVARGTK